MVLKASLEWLGCSRAPWSLLAASLMRRRHFYLTLERWNWNAQIWAEKPSKTRCGAVVCNVLTLDGSKLLPVCICIVNFYDVVGGSMLRCTGSGIGSVSLFVSNMLTLDGSKLFPVCICCLKLYDVQDGFLFGCWISGIAYGLATGWHWIGQTAFQYAFA